MDFNGKVVLITGASSGIGACLAHDCARRGATVVGCARSRERLDRVFASVRRVSAASLALECNVADSQQVEAMVAEIIKTFGKIDILINNAGVGMRSAFVDTPLDIVEGIMRTNYFGMVYCTHAVLPSMIARRRGHIVNISSGSGRIGAPGTAAYSASKFAMNGFSESLYHELRPFDVHVSVICPGFVQTEFNKAYAHVAPKPPPALIMTPEFVSRAVIGMIERGRVEITIPRWLALLCAFKRLAPAIFRAVAHRVYEQQGALPVQGTKLINSRR